MRDSLLSCGAGAYHLFSYQSQDAETLGDLYDPTNCRYDTISNHVTSNLVCILTFGIMIPRGLENMLKCMGVASEDVVLL